MLRPIGDHPGHSKPPMATEGATHRRISLGRSPNLDSKRRSASTGDSLARPRSGFESSPELPERIRIEDGHQHPLEKLSHRSGPRPCEPQHATPPMPPMTCNCPLKGPGSYFGEMQSPRHEVTRPGNRQGQKRKSQKNYNAVRPRVGFRSVQIPVQISLTDNAQKFSPAAGNNKTAPPCSEFLRPTLPGTARLGAEICTGIRTE